MKEFRKNVIEVFLKVNRSQKFYLVTIAVLPMLAIGMLTGIDFIKTSAVVTVFVFSFCGVISDLLYLYKKLWDTFIGKGIILLVYAASTNFAMSVSYQILNEIVKVEPTMLKYSLAFTSILTIPLFIAIGFMILLAAILLFGQVYMLIVLQVPALKKDQNLSKLTPKLEEYPFRFFIVRLFIYPVVIGLVLGMARSSSAAYDNYLKKSVKLFIYNMEAVKYSRCILLDKQKSIQINKNEIILIEPKNMDYVFSHVLCKPKLKHNQQLNKDAAKNAAPVN